jgi:hypothetical protein
MLAENTPEIYDSETMSNMTFKSQEINRAWVLAYCLV